MRLAVLFLLAASILTPAARAAAATDVARQAPLASGSPVTNVPAPDIFSPIGASLTDDLQFPSRGSSVIGLNLGLGPGHVRRIIGADIGLLGFTLRNESGEDDLKYRCDMLAGVQIDAVLASAYSAYGVQAGLVTGCGHRGAGVQVGLFNFVRTDYTGVQIGLVNWVGARHSACLQIGLLCVKAEGGMIGIYF